MATLQDNISLIFLHKLLEYPRPLNMAAPLATCTKEEMRGMIRFLYVEGVKPVDIICRCKPGMATTVYHEERSMNRKSASNREELMYVAR